MSEPTCFYCNDPVDPKMRSVWRRVVGWERKALSASRRGGSDIAGGNRATNTRATSASAAFRAALPLDRRVF